MKIKKAKDKISDIVKNKQIRIIIFILLAAFFNLSCEEDFSPKSEFNDSYTLNCIVVLSCMAPSYFFSTSYQAMVGKTYDFQGLIPDKAMHKELIRSAVIKINYYNNELALVDTTSIVRPLPLGDSIIVLNNYQPRNISNPSSTIRSLQGNEHLSLYAIMPDKSVLTSEVTVPRQVPFEFNRVYNHGITTEGNNFLFGQKIIMSWDDTYNPGYLYFPKMVLNAEVIATHEPLTIEVPIQYVNHNGKPTPIYPHSTKENAVSWDYAAVDSAMKNISIGYTDKSKIKILNCEFSIVVFERNLAAYYASTHGFMDTYSVRTDQNIYTNINGGFGIFGSSLNYSEIFPIDKNYGKSFGYKTIYE